MKQEPARTERSSFNEPANPKDSLTSAQEMKGTARARRAASSTFQGDVDFEHITGMSISSTSRRSADNYMAMGTMDGNGPPGGTPPLTLDALLREHLGYIRGCVAQRGIPAPDLDDVVQEALRAVAHAFPTFDPRRGDLRAWLKAIAHHHASMFLRRAYRRREQPWTAEILNVVHDAPDSEERLAEQDQLQLLDELLLEVPLERRQVVIAHDLEEAPMESVAEQLSISLTTARSRIRGARKDLKAAALRRKARKRGRCLVLLPPYAASCPQGDAGCAGLYLRLFGFVRRVLRDAAARVSGEAPSLWAQRFSDGFQQRMASTWSGMLVGGFVFLCVGPGGRADERPPPRALAGVARASMVLVATPATGSLGDLPSGSESECSPRVADPPARPALETRGSLEGGRVASSPQDVRRPAPGGPAAEAEERNLLRMVAAALAIGKKDLARMLLERHRREFPSGGLVQEREALLKRLARTASNE